MNSAGSSQQSPGQQSAGEAKAPAGDLAREHLHHVLRYIGVNTTSMLLDTSMFLGLTHTIGAPLVSSIIAYMIGLALNFVLSQRFVFHARQYNRSNRRLMIEFAATGAVGLMTTAVVTVVTIHQFAFTPAGSKGTAIAVCFVALYILRNWVVFRSDSRRGYNGSDNFISGAPDERWDNDALLQLKRVTTKDFEVVEMTEIVTPKSAK